MTILSAEILGVGTFCSHSMSYFQIKCEVKFLFEKENNPGNSIQMENLNRQTLCPFFVPRPLCKPGGFSLTQFLTAPQEVGNVYITSGFIHLSASCVNYMLKLQSEHAHEDFEKKNLRRERNCLGVTEQRWAGNWGNVYVRLACF